MPLSFHHIPFAAYAPKILEPKKIDKLCCQMDLFPTIMGMLRIPYVNNTFGIDILRESREYVYFSADKKIGCIDKEDFLVERPDGVKSVYRHVSKETANIYQKRKAKVDSMRNYTYSMIQAANWLIKNRKTGKQTKNNL